MYIYFLVPGDAEGISALTFWHKIGYFLYISGEYEHGSRVVWKASNSLKCHRVEDVQVKCACIDGNGGELVMLLSWYLVPSCASDGLVDNKHSQSR